MNEHLQIIIEEGKTNWKAFPLVFAVVLFMLLFLGGILSYFVVGRFFPSFGLFNQMLFLALAVAIGVSFGNRLKRLQISHDELSEAELRKVTVKAIESSGFTCQQEDPCKFRNNKKVLRLFTDWLGTEQIILTREGDELAVSGPGRYLNDLKWSLERQLTSTK